MFARRKRRARDEEEPLVPHGLIWQATERLPAAQEAPQVPPPATEKEPVTMPEHERDLAESRPESQLSARNLAPISPPPATEKEPVRIPEQESGLAATKPESQAGARKLGVISPPLPWPPVEVEQRPEQPGSVADAGSAPEVTEEEKAPSPFEQPQTLPDSPAAPEEKREPAMSRLRIRALAETSRAKEKFLSTSARFGDHGRSFLGKTNSSVVQFQAKLVGNCRVFVRVAGTNLHRLVRSLPMKEMQALPRHCVQIVAQGISRARLALKNGRVAGESVTVERGRQWSQGLLGSMSRVGRRRIHVRIQVVSPWSRFVGGAKSATEGWQGKPRAAADSRLWMSITMAGASALLTLGLIALIRPYAPASAKEPAPARPASQPEKVNSPNRPVSKPEPRIAPSTVPGPRQRTQKVPAAQTIPDRVAPKIAHSKPRVRRSEDDDYVAADT
ncbi:MAG: hypothetical protein JO159_19370, partial [Acidobacteria bacterium]|nr:hypothetical protein [Acidobacteriota bacterium]